MSTEGLYEQWERKTREQGLEQGRAQGEKHAFALVYEARFETLPATIAELLEVVDDRSTIERWMVLCATRSKEEIEAAVLAERPALAS